LVAIITLRLGRKMNKVITRDMIEDGLLHGVVTVCHEEWAGYSDGDLICKIGDGWFYIDNSIDETDYDEVVDSIIGTLDSFMMCLEDEDEYLYYCYYLMETLDV